MRERPISRPHLFQALIDFFEGHAQEDSLIVVFEDLHWADRSTRDLLDFLIGLLRDQRILLVASFRSDDLPSDHPLRSALSEWLRRPSVKRLDLLPLSPEDAYGLVAPLLAGSGVTREQAMRLVDRADGNPFFLEELVAAGPLLPGTPGRMRDLLLRRTRDLDPGLLRLLRIAAAGGTAIEEDLLSRVAGLAADETRMLLRVGIEAQLLSVDDRSCRFRHALLAEALHDDLLPAERREYHAAYADALASQGSPVPPGVLAAHHAEAGRVDEALAAWVAAGEAAVAQFAFAEAQHGYQSALDLWTRAEDPAAATAGVTYLELLRRLAEAAFLAGEARVACEVARRALAEIDQERDPLLAGLVNHRLARYLRNTEEYGEALAVQERAVELIPASPPSPERAEVLSGLALMLQYENRYHEARDLSIEAIDLAVKTGAVDAEIRARNTLGNAICTLEDVNRGLSIIGEALELARRTGDAHEQARSIWNLQVNRYLGARWSEFVDNAESTIASLRLTQPHWVVDQLVDTADVLHMLGRWDEADARIEAARREHPAQVDSIGVPELHIARHQFDAAKSLVAPAAQTSIMVDIEARVREFVFLADIEAWEGKPAQAVELINRALEQFAGQEKPGVIRYGIAIGIRAAADLAHAARLKGEASAVEQAIAAGETMNLRMRDVMAQAGPADGWKREAGCLAAQCEAELARLHGRPDPDAWLRANDHWLALSMPYRAAYCRYRWAEDALASGTDRVEVEPVLTELWSLLTVLGAKLLKNEVMALARRARIDLGDRYPSEPFGLTDREREVLAHVTRGSTNRQTAQALFISEKTASVHVSNILRKLAVANRGEAAAKAIKEGLVDVTDLARNS